MLSVLVMTCLWGGTGIIFTALNLFYSAHVECFIGRCLSYRKTRDNRIQQAKLYREQAHIRANGPTPMYQLQNGSYTAVPPSMVVQDAVSRFSPPIRRAIKKPKKKIVAVAKPVSKPEPLSTVTDPDKYFDEVRQE